jgi:signal transduction histidine kinase
VVASARGPGDSLIIEVRDRGRGIPPEIRDRIFDPFSSSKAQGIGIGLALVRQITEAHGGTIEVDHRPDGTTFRIVLPDARVSSPGIVPASPAEDGVTS